MIVNRFSKTFFCSSIEASIEFLFEKIEKKFGSVLVQHAFSYITASRVRWQFEFNLNWNISSLFYLWVSEDTRGTKKREFCRLLRREFTSKPNVRRYDRVLTTNELKCNKRADSNAIIGRRKLGKSKKLLRFTQAYLHKFT